MASNGARSLGILSIYAVFPSLTIHVWAPHAMQMLGHHTLHNIPLQLLHPSTHVLYDEHSTMHEGLERANESASRRLHGCPGERQNGGIFTSRLLQRNPHELLLYRVPHCAESDLDQTPHTSPPITQEGKSLDDCLCDKMRNAACRIAYSSPYQITSSPATAKAPGLPTR